MSDPIKHECGIAVLRLLKPLEYYHAKYGTALWGLNKLYLLMEKQHNRGQDGAGIASIKFDMPPGKEYINIKKSISNTPIKDIFTSVNAQITSLTANNPDRANDPNWLKENIQAVGELYMGHLRYGTFGKNNIDACHPFVRDNNWMTRNLAIAGNFNLTNVDELLSRLINKLGQHPKETSDSLTMLEKIGHFLDKENESLFKLYKDQGLNNKQISTEIAKNINIGKILTDSCKYWDGGYVIGGLLGHGDAFVLRDPAGIRPVFFWSNDEVIVVTSERPCIQTAFNVPIEQIKEIKPGHALILKKDGSLLEPCCKKPIERKSCTFERIYFSRGNDSDIYKERKNLGKALSPALLKAVDYDIANSVFSYIPNTASAAFYGLVESLNEFCDQLKKEKLLQEPTKLTAKKIDSILSIRPRIEKVAIKDAKLRTFITQDAQRDDLVSHVYDITYGTVNKGIDNLVVIDDSIVRGTTLKQSIISILSRLEPKKIIIASSAPQIRYPDCYGIDMAVLDDFIAFKAAIALLKEHHMEDVINSVYQKCLAQVKLPKEKIVNHVKDIYSPFTAEQISAKISELVTPSTIKCSVSIIYQTIEDLHNSCPEHRGDWYFTGNYPTPGGNKVVNRSFINYIEGKKERAY